VANSARSQMAEALAKKVAKELGLEVEVFSAGSRPAPAVHPLAIRVMKEVGVDLSGQRPKHLRKLPFSELDLVVVLCREEDCPFLPHSRVLRWDLPDPAGVKGTVEERLEAFRKVRDLLEEKIRNLFEELRG